MTDDELTEMACAAKLHRCMYVDIELPCLREFARMVEEAEREACAKALEGIGASDAGAYLIGKDQADLCAAAIRARNPEKPSGLSERVMTVFAQMQAVSHGRARKG